MDTLQLAYSTILNKIQIGVIILDQRERVLAINPAAEKILSVSQDQARDQEFSSVLSDWKRIQEECIKGEGKYVSRSEDGTGEVFSVSWIPLEDKSNEIGGSVILFTGIPEKSVDCNRELVRLHDELAAVNRNLDSQVRERTREVEALLVQRDHFIGQLGHDLRTPLIPLVGLIPFLIEQEKDPGIARLLSQMKTSIDVMQHTVEKIIDLARLNSMYFITDQVEYDLAELAGSVVNEFRDEAQSGSITVTIDIPEGIILKLSPVHAHEILRHLLSNAIKYNNPGGSILVGVEQTDECITLIVKDTGIGIEEKDLARIFEEFYRVDRSRQKLEAKGLGLAIVKRMVILDAGKIWAESEGLGKGSTFYVCFTRGDHETWLVS